MHRSLRSLAACLLLFPTLLAGLAGAVLAQGGGVGTDVTYVDEEGVARGTVTVRELGDPFTGADPARPPADGMRYVGLVVAFTAADDQTLEAQPYQVVLHDADGYIYTPSSVPRPADVTMPELQGQTMAPGNRISGFIGYSVPADAVLDEVLFVPHTYRAIGLADLRGAVGPAAATDVPFVSQDGSQALITVTVADPFTEFDPASPAEAGTRFVGLTAAFDNTGELPFDARPDELYLRAADGTLYRTAYVPRPADVIYPVLEGQIMAPGNRVSGFVGYMVPEASAIVGVDYWPSSERRVEIADLVGGGPAPTPGPVETPAPTPTVAPDASIAPAASAGTAQ